MSENVEPEEVEALMDGLEPSERSTEVVERDFSKPLRFGPKQMAELERQLASGLDAVQGQLTQAIGTDVTVELTSLSEVDADKIHDGLEPPFAALRFVAGGQPSWLIWDNAVAVLAVERILGAESGPGEARALSPLEGKVLGSLLLGVLTAVGETLGFTPEDAIIVEQPADFGSWQEAKTTPDAHRLGIELSVAATEEGSPLPSSSMRVYVPSPPAENEAPVTSDAVELPPNLERVEVELCARLDGCEVSLDQLLKLEEGDVIPLATRIGEPAKIVVEDNEIAWARLGTSRGQLAIRFEGVLEEGLKSLEESQ